MGKRRFAAPRRPSRYHRTVKRALAWFAGLVGVAALGRWLAQRQQPAASGSTPDPTTPAVDPAEELRRKLADARETEPAAEPDDEPDLADATVAGESLDERRARVHAKAREAIDAMGDDGGTS